MAITTNGGAGVTADAVATLSNKTLEAPVINNATFTGAQAGLEIKFGNNIVLEGTTADAFETTVTAGDPTADRTITLPDVSGTVVTTGNLSAITTITSATLTSPTITGAVFNDGSIIFEGATANDFETTLAITDPTADRTITFPDSTGTVALTSDITVTASSTNTFSNKSISLTTNTLSGTTAEFNTALSDGDFATLAGTETLSNKTLSSAVATTALTLNATAELRLADTDSSNYVGFKSPGTVSTNKIWTLPSADGSAGHVLQTDGSGVLSFAAASSGVSANDQAFAFAVQVFA